MEDKLNRWGDEWKKMEKRKIPYDQVYDITGAGDMVLSVLGMALAAGADYEAAIRLANIAGGLEVEKIGVAPVTRDELVRDLEAAGAAG